MIAFSWRNHRQFRFSAPPAWKEFSLILLGIDEVIFVQRLAVLNGFKTSHGKLIKIYLLNSHFHTESIMIRGWKLFVRYKNRLIRWIFDSRPDFGLNSINSFPENPNLFFDLGGNFCFWSGRSWDTKVPIFCQTAYCNRFIIHQLSEAFLTKRFVSSMIT